MLHINKCLHFFSCFCDLIFQLSSRLLYYCLFAIQCKKEHMLVLLEGGHMNRRASWFWQGDGVQTETS